MVFISRLLGRGNLVLKNKSLDMIERIMMLPVVSGGYWELNAVCGIRDNFDNFCDLSVTPNVELRNV